MIKSCPYKIWFTLFISLHLSCTKKPMTIEEVKIFHSIDTIHNRKSKVFIVDNFCNCLTDVLKFDSIVCKNIQGESFDYSMSFLVKSDITNIENLEKFPKDLSISLQNDALVGYRRLVHLPFLIRYDYYIDKVNMLEIERKLVCVDGKAVKYIEDNK